MNHTDAMVVAAVNTMLKKQGVQPSDKDDAVILLMLPPGKDLFWYLYGINQEQGKDF